MQTAESILEMLTPDMDRLHGFLGFSPDGRSIYFTVRDTQYIDWTLMTASLYGGVPHALITGVHSAVSFSPDGKLFAFLRKTAGGGGSLVIADAETGKKERTVFEPEKSRKIAGHGVSWSPDGKLIALAISDEDGHGCKITTVGVSDRTKTEMETGNCNASTNLGWLGDASGCVVLTAEANGPSQFWKVSYPTGETQKIANDTFDYSPYSLSVFDRWPNGRFANADRSEDIFSRCGWKFKTAP